jgi:hypothetical protein
VATGNRGSHCGIKSGIEYDSSIVEVIVECQAKTRRTLKQTGEPGYTTAVGVVAMTAPTKATHALGSGVSPAKARKPRKFPVSDGAPVEVVEDGPSLAGRLFSLGALLTIRPTLAIGSYAPRLPWPWGVVDFVSRVVRPAPGTVRATISLPNCTAQLVRASGVLPADGKRGVILYMHGGAFLTCGVNSHGRLVTALSRFADCPVLVANYRMIP